jgi:ATP-dependent helicase YprA (DUF1998 family)
LPATPATLTPPPTAPGSSFAELGVPSTLTAALAARGITTPRPIQARTLPDALAGRDVLGRAETGSGKTLAFGLPLLVQTATGSGKRRARRPRGLVLVPTRELADQVDGIILSTLPQRRSRWLGRDLPSRVRRDFGLRVTHVVSEPGARV